MLSTRLQHSTLNTLQLWIVLTSGCLQHSLHIGLCKSVSYRMNLQKNIQLIMTYLADSLEGR